MPYYLQCTKQPKHTPTWKQPQKFQAHLVVHEQAVIQLERVVGGEVHQRQQALEALGVDGGGLQLQGMGRGVGGERKELYNTVSSPELSCWGAEHRPAPPPPPHGSSPRPAPAPAWHPACAPLCV